MASKSVVDVAIEHIDAQIADLNRAKEILAMAAGDKSGEPQPKKRGRKRKAGMPSADEPNL